MNVGREFTDRIVELIAYKIRAFDPFALIREKQYCSI